MSTPSGPWPQRLSHPGYPPGEPPPPGYPGYGQYRPQPPKKKSGGLIIAIVAVSVVILIAIGGIVMMLGNRSAPAAAPIDPGAPSPPPDNPPPTDPPDQGQPPGSSNGQPVDLGEGISLVPADSWSVEEAEDGFAQLANPDGDLFVGQVAQLDAGTDPKALLDAFHAQVGEKYTDVDVKPAEDADLNSAKLQGASGSMTATASSGQGSFTVYVFSVASIRTDGLAVVGTVYFVDESETDQLNTDFSTMVNSMIQSQAG